MYGAILGDIIGSPYERDNNIKTKDFPLLKEDSNFTDDTIMTIAIADALMNIKQSIFINDTIIKHKIIKSLHKWGKLYPNWKYGYRFNKWLETNDNTPYNSYGNGSAMRVSSVGWLYNTLEKTQHIAKLTAEVTHNHPEGIKGAEAIASSIYLARNGYNKSYIKNYIENKYNYNLHRTCNEIRPNYIHKVSCQESVPEAIICFLEGNNVEDTIRNAISIGGDSDTIACMSGSIAEAMYSVPYSLKLEVEKRLYSNLLQILYKFNYIIQNSIIYKGDYDYE